MTRTHLAPGIYRDTGSLFAQAAVGTRPHLRRKSKRFPFGTSLKTIKAWQERTRVTLRGTATTERGTLAHDVDRYVEHIKHLAGWRERRSNLRAWTERYPRLQRGRLTTTHVRDSIKAWHREGFAPKTINHRLNDLRSLYRVLDGKRVITPVDDVDLLSVPRQIPTIVKPAVVLQVVARMKEAERAGTLRDAKTRGRFMVIASTGKRPSELKRARPADVDLDRRIWQIRDGKGGWSPGVYLNTDMMVAWRVFIEADAWGDFSTNSYVRVLRNNGWPDGVRPYYLRANVGIAASERGADLADVAAHLGHTRPQTTRNHYVPVLGTRLQELSESIDGRFGWE